ncbi:MAG: hypothetical protein JSR82_22890 [Verrucomicrobia bacterium]|nr:hypothetical protein [Verrucomicrobiota bacterium]
MLSELKDAPFAPEDDEQPAYHAYLPLEIRLGAKYFIPGHKVRGHTTLVEERSRFELEATPASLLSRSVFGSLSERNPGSQFIWMPSSSSKLATYCWLQMIWDGRGFERDQTQEIRIEDTVRNVGVIGFDDVLMYRRDDVGEIVRLTGNVGELEFIIFAPFPDTGVSSAVEWVIDFLRTREDGLELHDVFLELPALTVPGLFAVRGAFDLPPTQPGWFEGHELGEFSIDDLSRLSIDVFGINAPPLKGATSQLRASKRVEVKIARTFVFAVRAKRTRLMLLMGVVLSGHRMLEKPSSR